MPTVLVTGATGFLGQHLVRELVADGVMVRGLSRSEKGDAALAALGAQPVRGHLGDADALRTAVDCCEAVFHTAAYTNNWGPGIIRNIVLWIPLFPLIELIMLLTNDKGLRLGDQWAKTKVISVK